MLERGFGLFPVPVIGEKRKGQRGVRFGSVVAAERFIAASFAAAKDSFGGSTPQTPDNYSIGDTRVGLRILRSSLSPP